MKVSKTIHSYQGYHRANSKKKNTLENHDFLFTRFTDESGNRELKSITPDEILSFLTRLTKGTKQTTKRNGYSCLKSFFNYIRNTIDRVYIQDKGIEPELRIFPITCNAARVMVHKAGKMVGVNLRPHDLRRHAATNASRSETPVEIVSKVILRHAHLSAAQRYLGKVTDVEAMRWIENLYG